MLSVIFYIYLSTIAFAVIAGYANYAKYSIGVKVIVNLLGITLASESATLLLPFVNRGKEAVYHFYSIVEISAITIFFLESVKPRNYKKLKVPAIIFWAIIGITNLIYFQKISSLNSNMLVIESVVIIALSLIALYKIFIDDSIIKITLNTNFWIWVCFLMLWTTTFLFWTFFDELVRKRNPYQHILLAIQGIVNVAVYAGIGISLLVTRNAKHG